jgi:hypothetical protein
MIVASSLSGIPDALPDLEHLDLQHGTRLMIWAEAIKKGK